MVFGNRDSSNNSKFSLSWSFMLQNWIKFGQALSVRFTDSENGCRTMTDDEIVKERNEGKTDVTFEKKGNTI